MQCLVILLDFVNTEQLFSTPYLCRKAATVFQMPGKVQDTFLSTPNISKIRQWHIIKLPPLKINKHNPRIADHSSLALYHRNSAAVDSSRFPHSLFMAMLGENPDTCDKGINSYRKDYLHGSPDLIINNLHKHYTGFAIEFKNPNVKAICQLISLLCSPTIKTMVLRLSLVMTMITYSSN